MFHSQHRWMTTRVAASVLAGLTSFAALGGEPSAGAAALEIRIAPPETRVEVPPRRPSSHYVWVNGYWGWNGHRHVWVHGHYVRERRGYAYRQARWERTPHGHWRLHHGEWYRD